jgi:hypothetical protein
VPAVRVSPNGLHSLGQARFLLRFCVSGSASHVHNPANAEGEVKPAAVLSYGIYVFLWITVHQEGEPTKVKHKKPKEMPEMAMTLRARKQPPCTTKTEYKKMRCHFCRSKDTNRSYIVCRNYPQCRCGFCLLCLETHFPASIHELVSEGNLKAWACVVCQGLCHCTRCQGLQHDSLPLHHTAKQKPGPPLVSGQAGDDMLEVEEWRRIPALNKEPKYKSPKECTRPPKKQSKKPSTEMAPKHKRYVHFSSEDSDYCPNQLNGRQHRRKNRKNSSVPQKPSEPEPEPEHKPSKERAAVAGSGTREEGKFVGQVERLSGIGARQQVPAEESNARGILRPFTNLGKQQVIASNQRTPQSWPIPSEIASYMPSNYHLFYPGLLPQGNGEGRNLRRPVCDNLTFPGQTMHSIQPTAPYFPYPRLPPMPPMQLPLSSALYMGECYGFPTAPLSFGDFASFSPGPCPYPCPCPAPPPAHAHAPGSGPSPFFDLNYMAGEPQGIHHAGVRNEPIAPRDPIINVAVNQGQVAALVNDPNK